MQSTRCCHGVQILYQGCFDCIEAERRSHLPHYRWSYGEAIWFLCGPILNTAAPLFLKPAIRRRTQREFEFVERRMSKYAGWHGCGD